jgi:type II secretory pathway pseudopilin PulG
MKFARPHRSSAGQNAFSLVEVMVASGLAGIMIAAFMAGFAATFRGVQTDRENSRATQILLEKAEVLRLYNWDQITGVDTNVYIPTNFTASYYPDANNGGFTYSGQVVIANAPVSESYSNDLRQMQLTLTWTSAGVAHSQSITTYICRYGLQNYIY